jgi:hypothetical protein
MPFKRVQSTIEQPLAYEIVKATDHDGKLDPFT